MNKKSCETCVFCIAIGEGNHLCNLHTKPILVIKKYIPTSNYLKCQTDKKFKLEEKEMKEIQKPTQAQIDYAKSLIKRLGYDVDDYDFDKMSRHELSRTISELKRELD